MQNLLVRRMCRVLGAIACVAVVGGWTGTARSAEKLGELLSASGPVEIHALRQQVWHAASQRTVLHPGDTLRTGPGGSAEVAFAAGVVRMDENTVIVLPRSQAVPASVGSPAGLHLFLEGGRALFRVLKARLQGTFEVITPSIIVGVKGTTFGVEQGPNLGVVVFEGIVDVAQTGRPDLPSRELLAGHYMILDGGRLSAPRAYDPARPGLIWNGAPARTTSSALPVQAGGGVVAGVPGAPHEKGATVIEGAGALPPQVLPSGVAVSVSPGLSGGGTAGQSAGASPGLTGSDPAGVGAGAPIGGAPPGLTGGGPAGLRGGESLDRDDMDRGRNRDGGPPGLRGGGPPGLSGGGSPGQSGGAAPGLSAGGTPGLSGGGPPGFSGGGPQGSSGGGAPGLSGGGPPGPTQSGGFSQGHGGGRR